MYLLMAAYDPARINLDGIFKLFCRLRIFFPVGGMSEDRQSPEHASPLEGREDEGESSPRPLLLANPEDEDTLEKEAQQKSEEEAVEKEQDVVMEQEEPMEVEEHQSGEVADRETAFHSEEDDEAASAMVGEESSEQVDKEAPEMIDEATPENIAEVAPEQVEEEAPEGGGEVVREKVAEVAPEQLEEEASEDGDEVTRKKVAEVAPEKVDEEALEDVDEVVRERANTASLEQDAEDFTEKNAEENIEEETEETIGEEEAKSEKLPKMSKEVDNEAAPENVREADILETSDEETPDKSEGLASKNVNISGKPPTHSMKEIENHDAESEMKTAKEGAVQLRKVPELLRIAAAGSALTLGDLAPRYPALGLCSSNLLLFAKLSSCTYIHYSFSKFFFFFSFLLFLHFFLYSYFEFFLLANSSPRHTSRPKMPAYAE
jgi:hypothetical protein